MKRERLLLTLMRSFTLLVIVMVDSTSFPPLLLLCLGFLLLHHWHPCHHGHPQGGGGGGQQCHTPCGHHHMDAERFGCSLIWPSSSRLQFQAFPSTFALVLQAGVEAWESWLYSHSNGKQEAEVTIQFVPWFGRWNWNAWKNLVCMDARVRENVMAFNVLVHQGNLGVNLILLFVFTLKHWLGLQC